MNAEQLKASIIQQAIEGKLVSQLDAEEPVDQIGEALEDVPFAIPEKWKWVRLENACEYIQRGKSPKYSDIPKIPVIAQKCNQWEGFQIEKAKFIVPETLKTYKQERLLQNMDVLWNSTGLGTLGRVAVYERRLNPYEIAVADSHVTVIRTKKENLNPKFLYFYLRSPAVQNVIEARSDGSTKQKELATSTIKSYELPLPPIQEQARIVAKIEELLPLIEAYGKSYDRLQELNAELPGKLKASILQEAIQGKLVPQLDSEGAVEQIGDTPEDVPFAIPEKWKWVHLTHLCDYIQRGKSPKYSDIPKIPVIAQKCNQWDGFQIEKAKFIDPDSLKTYKEERLLQDQDVLWNSTGLGTLGRLAMYETCLNPYGIAVADSHVTVIRTKKGLLNPKFLYFYLCSPTVQNVIESRSDGSTKQKELATSTVKGYEFPLPPLLEQNRIVAKAEELLKRVETLSRK